MPYITQEEREPYYHTLEELVNLLKNQPLDKIEGHLNFVVTSLIKRLYSPRYFNYNRAIGVLECIKLEFYRRVIAPYEDVKISEHGDV